MLQPVEELGIDADGRRRLAGVVELDEAHVVQDEAAFLFAAFIQAVGAQVHEHGEAIAAKLGLQRGEGAELDRHGQDADDLAVALAAGADGDGKRHLQLAVGLASKHRGAGRVRERLDLGHGFRIEILPLTVEVVAGGKALADERRRVAQDGALKADEPAVHVGQEPEGAADHVFVLALPLPQPFLELLANRVLEDVGVILDRVDSGKELAEFGIAGVGLEHAPAQVHIVGDGAARRT